MRHEPSYMEVGTFSLFLIICSPLLLILIPVWLLGFVVNNVAKLFGVKL